jgi:hypothetical protein
LPDGRQRITSNTYMFVEALERALETLGRFLPHVVALACAAQQHGSVYWHNGAGERVLDKLDPSRSFERFTGAQIAQIVRQ